MDTEAAIDNKIKPQLIETFGRQVANSLLTQATLSYVSTDGSERERFESFVYSICSDERVIGAWGRQAAEKRTEEWKALLEASPRPVDKTD